MPVNRRTRTFGVLLLIALSTPLALALETVLRGLIMPPDFDRVRAWLAPMLTPWAWATVPLTAVATGIGWWLFGWLEHRGLARAEPEPSEDQRAKARFDALILATSAPQLPAILATLLFMMGAPLAPVLVAMTVATLGVVSLGLRMRDEPTTHAEPDHEP